MSEESVNQQGGQRESFDRLTQINLVITILGTLILATPVLFVIAAIGPGADVVRLGLAITFFWLLLIGFSFVFSRHAMRHGRLGK